MSKFTLPTKELNADVNITLYKGVKQFKNGLSFDGFSIKASVKKDGRYIPIQEYTRVFNKPLVERLANDAIFIEKNKSVACDLIQELILSELNVNIDCQNNEEVVMFILYISAVRRLSMQYDTLPIKTLVKKINSHHKTNIMENLHCCKIMKSIGLIMFPYKK